jgi:hypothetical protein
MTKPDDAVEQLVCEVEQIRHSQQSLQQAAMNATDAVSISDNDLDIALQSIAQGEDEWHQNVAGLVQATSQGAYPTVDCLNEDEVEAYVIQNRLAAERLAHLESCSACTGVVRDVRAVYATNPQDAQRIIEQLERESAVAAPADTVRFGAGNVAMTAGSAHAIADVPTAQPLVASI